MLSLGAVHEDERPAPLCRMRQAPSSATRPRTQARNLPHGQMPHYLPFATPPNTMRSVSVKVSSNAFSTTGSDLRALLRGPVRSRRP